MRGFILGIIMTLAALAGFGYLFVRGGGISLATTAPPLPLEAQLAHLALRASIGSAKDAKNPLPHNEDNMQAGAKLYRNDCAGCHGAPQHPHPVMWKAMFPPPPQLFTSEGMVTDDLEGSTFWKVTNGIRLSGMPGFHDILTDSERWQLSMLLAHADKITPAVQEILSH
jgi:thiosulfate dehydrogenase